jgi:hypothetical protein
MANEPQDIFKDVEPIKSPVASPKPPTPLVLPVPPARQSAVSRYRWQLLAGGILILLVGTGVVIYLLRSSTTETPTLLENSNKNTNTANVSVIPTNTGAAPVVNAADLLTNDKDRDGLTDDEETKLGTNLSVADTDGDGLSDYDEVKVYKTNPLKPDTDGDGNTDGAEVKKGYNPNGNGLLLDFEAARQKLTK